MHHNSPPPLSATLCCAMGQLLDAADPRSDDAMRYRIPRSSLISGMTLVGVGVVIGVTMSPTTTRASSTARYTLNAGDTISMPAIGWGCDYETTKGKTALTCAPGVPGT